MSDKIFDWLMDNADAPIRYRLAREFLCDGRAAKRIEPELLGNREVRKWLNNLKPETPPQSYWMIHGSFDFCLENSVLKAVQLGLHAGFSQVAEAVTYFTDIFKNNPVVKPYRKVDNQLNLLMIASMLTLAGFRGDMILGYMLESLNEIHDFVKKGDYGIYISDEERSALKGVPQNWKNREFIKKELFDDGPVFPLVYDLLGLNRLYGAVDTQTDGKIDAVISYITTDRFHETVRDGYGIVICDGNKYYGMGWDPKYPGWSDVAEYIGNDGVKVGVGVPKLLFFAQYIVNYPAALKTEWYGELLACLDRCRTDGGTYIFPKKWMDESRGYAVAGHHLSFGENRRKENWLEIESTFYMQLLKNPRKSA